MRITNAMGNEVKSSLWFWWLKLGVLVIALGMSVKVAESFMIYSTQTAGLAGLSAYRKSYEIGRTGQLVTILTFVALQAVGGLILRSVMAAKSDFHDAPRPWWRFALVHLLLSLLAIAIAVAAVLKFK